MIRTEWKDLHRILGKASNGAEDVIFERNKRGKLCTVRFYRNGLMTFKITDSYEKAKVIYEREAKRILKKWKIMKTFSNKVPDAYPIEAQERR